MNQPRLTYAPGVVLQWGELVFTIVSQTDDNKFVLEGENQTFRNATRRELDEAFELRELSFLERHRAGTTKPPESAKATLSDYSEKGQAAAKRKRSYLEGLLAEGPIVVDKKGVLKDRIARLGVILKDPEPPSTISIWRWNEDLKASGGDVLSLVPKYHQRGGAGSRRRDPAVAEIEDRLIDDQYLVLNGDSVKDVHQQLELEVKRENQWRTPERQLIAPVEATLRREIGRYDQYEVVAARLGPAEANRRFEMTRSVVPAHRKLHRVEIDPTPLDLFVIDEESQLPWGRPTLYAGIDNKTKMPWAMHVGFGNCSTSSFLECIGHGIKPKTYIKSMYPMITSEWFAHGVPVEIRVDNGPENHSRAIKDAGFELGFDTEFCPKRKPNWKGSIERYLKRINYDLMHKLPGTSFAKYWKRCDYDSLKYAVIDMKVLMRILHLWFVDIYPREFHRSLGMSPLKSWQLSK